jgi:hypothetical protein
MEIKVGEGVWEQIDEDNYKLVSLTGVPTILPRITYYVGIKKIFDCHVAGVSYCDKAFFYEPITQTCKTFAGAATWAQEKLLEIVNRYEKVLGNG